MAAASKVPRKLVGVGPPSTGHDRVYYLTTSLFAVSNVALQRIKVARFSDLNDPFELLSVDRSDLKNRAAVRDQTDQINKELGLICFSKMWKNPVMWGHYAEKHTGICMGFDVPHDSLRQVIYKGALRQVNRDPKTSKPKLTSKDIELLKTTKFKDWGYEQEMRFFVKPRGLKIESGKYFFPFSAQLTLRELIIGPRCEIGIDPIRKLVSPSVVVQKARLAFRTFAVVVDHKASRQR